jgi:hypothetical protein
MKRNPYNKEKETAKKGKATSKAPETRASVASLRPLLEAMVADVSWVTVEIKYVTEEARTEPRVCRASWAMVRKLALF